MDSTSGINYVDIVAAALALFGMIRGMLRGFSREMAGLLGVLAGIMAGWVLYVPLGHELERVTRLQQQGAYIMAFLLTVIGGILCFYLVRILLRRIMEITFKGPFEKIGGALSGLLRYSLVIAAFFFVVSLLPSEYLHRVFIENSVVGSTVSTWGPAYYNELAEKIPELPLLKSEPGGNEESEKFQEDGQSHSEARHRRDSSAQ